MDMTDTPRTEAGDEPRMRADARRSRAKLLEAATAAFAETGADAPLEDIARRAGVGIGTLYRHFPTRDAMVHAVYSREVDQLAQSAARLIATVAPIEALHQWLRLCIDYIATKKVLATALGAMAGGVPKIPGASAMPITEAVTRLLDHAQAAGEVRADVQPDDLLRALGGFTYGAEAPGWQASALRLIDLLMDGLRLPPPAS